MNDTFRKRLASALVLVIIFGLPIGSVFAENQTGEERLLGFSEVVDGIPIDEEHFPDEDFRDFVEANYDTNKDGHLSDAERNAVETIILGGGEIKSLEGIAYFPELVKLDASWQNLRSLDLKNNSKLEILFCQGNSGLRSLDMTQNSNLKHLVCTQTAVKSLDLSANPELVTLECGSTGIENLDLSGKDQLQTVNAFMNEKLKKLDLSGCTSLKTLDCYKCGMLEKLDLSESTALESLNAYQNYAMKELIFAKETPGLSRVNCESDRALGSITIPDGRAITTLNCSGVGVTTLDISTMPQLQSLYCYSNNLMTLDLRNNLELRNLECENNQLTELDIANNPKLESLLCYTNQITSLYTSKNIRLTELRCFNNSIAALDLSQNKALEMLRCQENALTTLDLSENASLTDLDCSFQSAGAQVMKNADGRWNFDMGAVVGEENIGRVSGLQANGGTPVSATEIQFGKTPTVDNTIQYCYDPQWVNGTDKLLEVSLTPTAVCKVTFDSGNGESFAETAAYNTPVAEPEAPAREGYVFKGWYADSGPWDFNTPVTENITLTARWSKTIEAGVPEAGKNQDNGFRTNPKTGINLEIFGMAFVLLAFSILTAVKIKNRQKCH